ncbi:hypothetical protein G3I32_20930 [Streptomyces coelicoflavus]|uniref:aspartate kinase n=1 Tax=Streptomyces coelicoflavus TaxID=285562 RepID=A0A7K3PPG4_9ACTN|nr:hypothetical protein [Streptomyces coelicoflavus]NEB11271.1 hypothetical protein [Streptomyces coelicoflavus]
MEHPIIYGVCHDTTVARVTVTGAPTQPGGATAIFRALANSGIKSDMAQNTPAPGGRNDLSFIVDESDAATAMAVLEQVRDVVRFDSVSVDVRTGRVTMIGASLRSNSEIIARYFESLRDAGVAVEMVAATDNCIAVVTRRWEAAKAAEHLKATFRQGEPRPLL